MEWIILAIIVAWVLHTAWQGYKQETAPPLAMRDTGNGVMEPVCSQCQAKLVSVTRQTDSGLVSVVAVLIGLAGVAAILFINWITGAVALGIAILINMAGKGSQTVLTCPACGTDARIIN